jgi:hypothetical protein
MGHLIRDLKAIREQVMYQHGRRTLQATGKAIAKALKWEVAAEWLWNNMKASMDAGEHDPTEQW